MNRYAIKRNNRNKIVGILNYDERAKKFQESGCIKKSETVIGGTAIRGTFRRVTHTDGPHPCE